MRSRSSSIDDILDKKTYPKVETELPHTDPLIGRVLSGRFRILSPLGQGGMGTVYKALQSPLERVVALKVLKPRFAAKNDPEFERRFFNEARYAAQLHHPNTITVHDYGRTEDGLLFIAMEYVEGETLQSLLNREKTLEWPRALTIVAQIARSLREAHKLGIIHRDLKPANVMVVQDDSGPDLVKVLDFGLVKPFLADGPLGRDEQNVTQAGIMLGSPLYMAPESAKHATDPRSDVYSLGVLLFHVLTGQPPFVGTGSIDIIVKHIREAPPKPQSLKSDIPDEVSALVLKCLEKEPHKRYQSMEDILDALNVIASTPGNSGAFTDPRAITGASLIIKPSSSEMAQMRTASQAGSLPAARARPSIPRRAFIAYPLLAVFFGALSVTGLTYFLKSSQQETEVPVEQGSAAPVVKELVDPQPQMQPPPIEAEHTEISPTPSPEVLNENGEAQAKVHLVVGSTPPGATVSIEGKTMGVTPLQLEMAPTQGAELNVPVALALEGYQSMTTTANGTGTVEVSAVLKKQMIRKRSPTTTAPNTKAEPGFKEDPYE